MCEMRGDFLKNWKAQRIDVYRGMLNKKRIKCCITNGTRKNKNKKDNEPIPINKWIF